MIQTISLEDLVAKIERGDDFKLVMTMGEFAFQLAHIPGSLSIQGLEDALTLLQKDEEIVVYCSNPRCPASIGAYHFLKKAGYQNVRRFAGGLDEWEASGRPLVRLVEFE